MSLRRLVPSRPRPEAPFGALRVAAIVDEFTEAGLEPEVTLLSLDARVWRAQLAIFRPQLLFVESAWRGAGDSWRLRVAAYPGRSDSRLDEVVDWCRGRGIPTVFWNKEDPVHFDRFLERARRFDRVYTTDQGRLDDYRRALGRDAEVLMFAAQPRLHHAGGGRREDVVCFAGSYGDATLAERRGDLEMLLDAAAGFDLRILDRHSRARHPFPERYRPHLADGVSYRRLADLQRRYKVFLNVNSVKGSRTMFSRRVFELLASGAAVVSNASAGLSELFGDVVAVVGSKEEAREAIGSFLADDGRERAERGMRRVLEAHTWEARLRTVCAGVGLSA
jgi:hypothetical protein